jgi:hypothetical protein
MIEEPFIPVARDGSAVDQAAVSGLLYGATYGYRSEDGHDRLC